MLLDIPTPENILSNIKQCTREHPSDFIILCGEDADLNYPTLIKLLNKHGVRYCGGIFPGIIAGNKSYSDKVLLLPVQFDSTPVIVRGLDDGDIQIPSLSSSNSLGSLFILVDGLSNWISKFMYSIYKELGSEYQVFGSGTGVGNFERNNCIFSNEGFFKNAAVIVLLKNSITQSIRHGWKTIAGPFLATKFNANVLEQINWEPAYKIYKELVEQKENIVLTEDNYYDYAMHYPFGVHRANRENLIRDPVALGKNQAIRFGAEIPAHSVLYLMKSEIDDMLLAGHDACEDAINRCKQPNFLFIADCISRTWILNERFEEELNNIATKAETKNIPVFGVLSMGEISSADGALFDYHHKTIVISILEHNE